MNATQTNGYAVVDARTNAQISTHATRKAAQTKADRLDRQYGAVRYIVKFI